MTKPALALFVALVSASLSTAQSQSAKIAATFKQTTVLQVSCGEDVDQQTCKFFARAVHANLKTVSVATFYDPEVLVQSFYVLPHFVPGLHVTVRLIEADGPKGTVLHVSGFAFPPGKDINEDSIRLPHWTALEGGRDTGPMEADKAAAASKLAKDFAAYWLETIKKD